MTKLELFNATRAYEERLKPSLKEMIQNSTEVYSSQRYLRKVKEYGLPQQDFVKCGIVPELAVIWYSKACKLFLWRYESNDMEEISTFSSEILFVDVFKPKEGIFNHKIQYCLIVITETQAIVYGVERDSGFLVNTDMVVAISSAVQCYVIHNGNIYIGCGDGNVYEIVYRGSEAWVFKNMYLYNPNASVMSNFIPSILKRKKQPIKSITCNSKYLLTLGKSITIYNIDGGFYKVKEITCVKDYIALQILDGSMDDILYYCVLKDGTRDFYNDGKTLITKKCTLNDTLSQMVKINVRSTTKRYAVVQKSQYQGALVGFVQFNEFQKLNYDKQKPIENQEILSLNEEVNAFTMYQDSLMFVSKNKLIFYEILTPGKYVTCNRIEDVYNVFKNFGEKESLIMYYQLLASDEDVSKIEYLCLKSEDNQSKCLSSLVYRELKSLMFEPIIELWNDERRVKLEEIQFRFSNLLKKIKSNNLKESLNLLELYVQTIYYISLLMDYSIPIGSINLFKLLYCDEIEFKKRTLKDLIDVFKANQSVDPLINTLGNRAPLYLPVEEVFYQRGFDLLKKYPSRDKLWESLKNFRNIVFNEEVINKYNELGFFSGSMTLIRQHFTFSYEKEVELLKSCVKCQGAVNQALEDTREEFNYAFFEALCYNLKSNMFSRTCTCCDGRPTMTLSAIIKIQSPFLEKFLHEKTVTDNDMSIFELHWKYLAFRNERSKAAKSLLYLVDNKKISLEQRVDLLEKARTVSLHTEMDNEIKIRFDLLNIQKSIIANGANDPIITNMLLSADDLFNDYAYKYPSLALRLISLSNTVDKNIIKDYWAEGMKGSYKNACSFLLNNKFEGNVMDLEIIMNILITKLNEGDELGRVLLEAGFNFYDIKRMLERKIKRENHPLTRNFLIADLSNFLKLEPKCNKLEKDVFLQSIN